MQSECAICGDPTDGTVCRRETTATGNAMRDVITLAGEVETAVSRLARFGDRGGQAGVVPEPHQAEEGPERFRLPLLAHGWVARLDRPQRGALAATALPYLPGMARQVDEACNTITTWTRHVCEERGFRVLPPAPVQGPLCRSGWDCNHQTCDLIRTRSIGHPAARAAVFLLTQLDWIRHRPEAAEALEELQAAAAALRRCVDRPPALAYAGPCWNDLNDGKCEFELYAVEGATSVKCGGCEATWDIRERRQWLLAQSHDALANAATLAAALSSLDQPVTSSMIRNYADRGRIVAHGHDQEGRPMYRVGDVLRVIEAIARRKSGVAA